MPRSFDVDSELMAVRVQAILEKKHLLLLRRGRQSEALQSHRGHLKRNEITAGAVEGGEGT